MSPSASASDKTLEHDDARPVAEHGARWRRHRKDGSGRPRQKVAAFLIKEAALLRNGDVDAAGERHVALIIEQRAASLVDG